MIVENKSTPIIREGLNNESLFNIKKENVAHIFSILRNQLYSDKILAVIREYSTNAMDAHVEDNVERPFEITLPTPFKSEFIVRDFGKGLSPEEIVDIFASYGESTKRLSNSFTGMLGLGSKSAFAYTNNFVVKSRYNGVLYTYSAFIDESNVGAISLVNQTPTNETGLSVHINVKASDCRIFEERCKTFFQHCTIMPQFTNNTTILESYKNSPSLVMRGEDWKIYKTGYSIYLHMGNVCYGVPYNMLSDLFTIDQLKIVKGFQTYNNTFHGDWHIFAPIGSVKPSASRESLEFNDQTKKYIGNKIYEICIEIRNRLLYEFNMIESDWQKRIYVCKVSKIVQSLPSQMVPYNQPYTEKDLMEVGINKIKYEMSAGRFTDYKHLTLLPRNNVIHFLDSPSVTRVSVKSKINSYLQNNKIKTKLASFMNNDTDDSKSIIIINFKTDEDKEKFKKNKKFEGINYVDLSTLPYVPQKTNSNTIKGEVGELYVFHPDEYYNLKKWKATEERPKEIVWVEISNFMPKEYNKSNEHLSGILESLKHDFISLNENIVIYGVKSAHIKNVGSDWIELKDYYKNKVKKFKTKHKAEYDAYCKFCKLDSFWTSFIFDAFNFCTFPTKPIFDPVNFLVPEHLYEPFKPLYLEYCMYKNYANRTSNINVQCARLGLEFYKEQKIKEIEELTKDIPILSVFSKDDIPYKKLHEKINELL